MTAPALTNQDELRATVVAATVAARREVKALLAEFDSRLWEDPRVLTAIRTYLTGNSLSRLTICLLDATGARTDAPRLMALCERLPSRCEIRLAHEEHRTLYETFVLFDRYDYVRRATPLDRVWTTQAKPPNEADRLHKLFTQVWDEAAVHPDLRRLSL